MMSAIFPQIVTFGQQMTPHVPNIIGTSLSPIPGGNAAEPTRQQTWLWSLMHVVTGTILQAQHMQQSVSAPGLQQNSYSKQRHVRTPAQPDSMTNPFQQQKQAPMMV